MGPSSAPSARTRACIALLVFAPALPGCFSSSTDSPAHPSYGDDATDVGQPDATLAAETGAPDGATEATGPTDAASDAGPDAGAEAGPRTCAKSTCPSVKVIFHGQVAGADGGPEQVELAVDLGAPDAGPNATVLRTVNAADPALGQENLLVGDFVTGADGGLATPLQYANDNNACNVPIFDGRQNAYYLAPMQGLPVDPAWYAPSCGCGGQCGGACVDGGACDYESEAYSQSCPNFGTNCIVTPKRIDWIEIASTDPTCEVCFYSSATPSAATILACYPSGNVPATGAPALLRLDDGSNCASYVGRPAD